MKRVGDMQCIESSRFQSVPEQVNQSLVDCRHRPPLQSILPPYAFIDEGQQTPPVFGIGFSGSHGESSAAFELGQFAEEERRRISPDEFLRQLSLSANMEMQG